MAEPPLLTLSDIALTQGGTSLFTGLSTAIQPRERIALVGRNGSGKSTLMRIMAGAVKPDAGERFVRPGSHIAQMHQDPDFSGFDTLRDFAAQGVDAADIWRVDMALEGMSIDGAIAPQVASGGERRRAALAGTLAQEADLLLLDEPTNHLDIDAILWLEDAIKQSRAAMVIVSHDRTFLRNVTDRLLWIDRGEARKLNRGFSAFEEWRDKTFEEEDLARHKLDRLIKAEGRWAVEGISARRKRNQGRVRRLAELRAERRSQIQRVGPAKLELATAPNSGKLVVEATDVSVVFEGRQILRDFSLRIGRGERVAIVGPNGAGKTTLLKLLTGLAPPQSGSVRLGTNLSMAYFDQNRAELNPALSLWDTLTGDPALGVSGKNDQIMVRGQPRHVLGYLKDYLFSESQARGPVSALSGGEKARLLLARLMAENSNLLVLDEPTNDLDVETLDLLQEVIDDYAGTVLLVSHDRDFVDRVATTTIAMEGDGRAIVYAGGWSDYQAQRGPKQAKATDVKSKPKAAPASPPRQSGKLNFNQERRLSLLPGEIAQLESDIGKLEALLSDPELYAQAPEKFRKASAALSQRQDALASAEDEWLELESLRDSEGDA